MENNEGDTGPPVSIKDQEEPKEQTPTIQATVRISTMLLIPFIMGLKISLHSRDKFVREHFRNATTGFEVTDWLWGVSNALMPLGACIGSLFIPLISNKRGRKKAITFSLFLGLIGNASLFSAFVTKIYKWMVFSRLFDGLSIGSSMIVGVLYIFEIIPPSHTSYYRPLVQLCINFGIVFSSFFSLDCITRKNWSITAYPVIIAQILVIMVLWTLPESPSFFYGKYKDYELLKRILRRLRGPNYFEIDKEAEDIKNEVERKSEQQNVSIGEFLGDSSLRKSIFATSCVQLFQQLSGINAIIFYANNFIQKANFSSEDIGSLLILLSCFLGSVIFTPFLSRFSGKLLLLIGYAAMSVCHYVSFIFWKVKLPPISIVGCFALFLFIFQVGPGPLAWTITIETYEIRHRMSAQSFFIGLNWMSAVLVTFVFMAVSKPIGLYVSLIFGSFNLIAFIILSRFLVDLQNKTQEEVMKEYQK